MFGNIGVTEMLLIAVVVLLLFGAKRLPEIGASMGKGIREFKRSITDTQDALMKPEEPNRVAPPAQSSILDPEEAPRTSGEPKRLSQ